MNQSEAKRRVNVLMKNYNLYKQEVMLAMLLYADVSLADAFECIFRTSASDKEGACRRYIANKPNIQILVDALRQDVNGKKSVNMATYDADAINLRTKEGVLTAYEEELKSTSDIKQRMDILSKIADLQKLKNEEDKQSQDLIFYYLPLRCEECPMKKTYDLSQKEREENKD